jgi:hypothetical protein
LGEEEEEPRSEAELRLRYEALKREYQSLRGSMEGRGEDRRRSIHVSNRANVQPRGLDPPRANAPPSPSKGELILKRLAISQPTSLRISADDAFVKELMQVWRGEL